MTTDTLVPFTPSIHHASLGLVRRYLSGLRLAPLQLCGVDAIQMQEDLRDGAFIDYLREEFDVVVCKVEQVAKGLRITFTRHFAEAA